MNHSTILRSTATALLSLSGLAASFSASAYEYGQFEKVNVASGSGQMKPWDNQGNLPDGDSKLAELHGIDAQISERTHRLEITAFNLQMMEHQVSDKSRLASLHTDYQSQMASYNRWRESAERRRQAILGQLKVSEGGLVRTSLKALTSDYAE